MLRSLAFVAALVTFAVGPAYSQSSPPRPTDNPTTASPTDLPDPLEVPRWMGHAVENILSGDDPDKKTEPARQ